METVTLYNLVKDIGHQLGEMNEGVTTGNSDNTLTFLDANFSHGNTYQDNEWAGSEVMFEEPAFAADGGINNTGGHTLNGSSPAGMFFSALAFRSSGVVPAGLNFAILRPGGQGTPFRGYAAALRWAMDKLNIHTASVNSALVTAADDWDYTIPAGLSHIYDITLSKTGYYPLRLTPRQWQMRPGRGLHLGPEVNVAMGWTLNLHGWANDTLPTAIDGTVYCERQVLVDWATEYLLRNRAAQPDNSRAAQRQQERLRFERLSQPANLRSILP